jgi:hypothetical protein
MNVSKERFQLYNQAIEEKDHRLAYTILKDMMKSERDERIDLDTMDEKMLDDLIEQCMAFIQKDSSDQSLSVAEIK